jgi:hypothetical protein
MLLSQPRNVSAIKKAVESSNEGEVRRYLATHHVDELIDGESLLHMACTAAKSAIVKLLLKRGVWRRHCLLITC